MYGASLSNGPGASCSLHRPTYILRTAPQTSPPGAKMGLILTVKALTLRRHWPRLLVRRTRIDRIRGQMPDVRHSYYKNPL